MHKPLNYKSMLHPQWDGPFIVLTSMDKDVYQLATANRYRLLNLVNIVRIRKLDKVEHQRYTEDFWDASTCLWLHDQVAKDQAELHDINKHLAEATYHHLEDQCQGKHLTLAEIDQLALEKHQTEKLLMEACTGLESNRAQAGQSAAQPN